MTAAELRQNVVKYAESFVGAVQGSAKHKELINLYNSIKPYPDGWAMTYTAPWCAAAATVFALGGGILSIFPASANCGTMLNKAKAMGCWVENDAYRPKPGDFILYDWGDTGIGDNTGAPDHVGVIASVGTKNFKVIEGNMTSAHKCGYRTVAINGKNIRGFIVPKYEQLAGGGSTPTPTPAPKPTPAEKAIDKTYKVLGANGANIRRGPGTDEDRIGGLAHGQTFHATKESGDWVFSPTHSGWICKGGGKYLQEVSNQQSSETIKKSFKVLSRQGANVRKEPNASAKRVGGIAYGQVFTATKESGDWVFSPAHSGWICKGGGKYLQEVSNARTWQVVTTKGCHVRSGPSTAYNIVGGARYGTRFKAEEEQGAWIKSKQLGGWICTYGPGGTYCKRV